jgi:hypothetical protein
MSVNIYNKDDGSLTALASGQRTWVGTQAAYKAAKQAGTLPNNAIIAITDDEVDHNHYSTEETETGEYWIDGKPIYKKTIDCGTVTGGVEKNVPHGITNAETVMDMRGYWFFPSSPTSNIGILPYADNGVTWNVLFYPTYLRLMPRQSNFTGAQAIMTVWYTKTTD